MIKTTRFILFALAACGDNAPIPPTPEPPPTRDITGTASFVTADEAGHQTAFPIGLHDTLVSAQFALGEGWDVREGTAHADGTFAIHDVPVGDYWLETYDVASGQRQLLWTNATVLDFQEHGIGRGDVALAGDGSTVTFAVDGLDPFQPDDGLQIASGNLGLSGNVFAAIADGATATEITRGWAGQPLISAAEHDHLILTQLRVTQDAASGFTYTSPIASVSFDAVEQHDRGDTRLVGTFTRPPNLDYDLRWNRSEFAAASAAIHPSRVGPAGDEQFTLRAMPGGTGAGTSPFAPVVLAIGDSLFTGSTDLDQVFPIANPYPASWLFNDLVMAFPVTIPVPGTADSIVVPSAIEVNTNELASVDHPIVPLVTAPQAPAIGGLDLFADHEGVGVSPTISWTAPAHGTPTAYVIVVSRWELQFGFSDLADVATLIVPGDTTSVRMPERVLEVGEQYVLRIAAVSQEGQDVRDHSTYALALPYGYADLVSNTFSP